MHRRSLRCRIDRQLQLDSWDGPWLSPLNWAILALILASVALFTLETEQSIATAHPRLFDGINLAILLVFFAEFVLRIWSSGETKGIRGLRARLRYAGRGWLVFDFLAFAPELFIILLIALGFPIPVTPEGLKALRLVRLAKLAKFSTAAQTVLEVVSSVRYQLVTSAIVAAALIYLSAVLIYYIESNNDPENFGSVVRSLWWSVVTLTTVGYGDVVPDTALGKVVAGFIAIVGLGIIALPSGIIAGAFMEKLREKPRRAKDADRENA